MYDSPTRKFGELDGGNLAAASDDVSKHADDEVGCSKVSDDELTIQLDAAERVTMSDIDHIQEVIMQNLLQLNATLSYLITSAKEVMFLPEFVCLSVC